MKKINTHFSQPVSELIKKRYSCRTYSGEALTKETQKQLKRFIRFLPPGPFGSLPRFDLVASTNGDSDELSDLGTYGFIKDAPGFFVGATEPGGMNLEDYGYMMEVLILLATDLGLGTCWLGGTFTRSSFADRINTSENEIIPAVTAVGYPASEPRKLDARIRQTAKSDQRLPWEDLFFLQNFETPLSPSQAEEYSKPLEMVRLGPSASNKQPWRIIKKEGCWHFFLQRTPGYRDHRLLNIMKIEDLQRVDMGIAMCHFELTAISLGLDGVWQIQDQPGIQLLDESQYLATWISKS